MEVEKAGFHLRDRRFLIAIIIWALADGTRPKRQEVPVPQGFLAFREHRRD
jgi:hypothetical protein